MGRPRLRPTTVLGPWPGGGGLEHQVDRPRDEELEAMAALVAARSAPRRSLTRVADEAGPKPVRRTDPLRFCPGVTPSSREVVTRSRPGRTPRTTGT